LGAALLITTPGIENPRIEAGFPERRHFSRNPKWDPSDFGCKKSGDGHCLRQPTFVLRPSRRALRSAPGLPQWLDTVSHGLAFRLCWRSRATLRRNARPYGYAGAVALRSSLTLSRFPVPLPRSLVSQHYDRQFRITHTLKKKYLELYRLPTWAAVR